MEPSTDWFTWNRLSLPRHQICQEKAWRRGDGGDYLRDTFSIARHRHSDSFCSSTVSRAIFNLREYERHRELFSYLVLLNESGLFLFRRRFPSNENGSSVGVTLCHRNALGCSIWDCNEEAYMPFMTSWQQLCFVRYKKRSSLML